MKECVVIGGGIIGLCSAYYLAKAGHKVSLVEKGDLSSGCSFMNAGMIVPSHVIPLAQPGMISKGIRWMFNSKSPFYIRPRINTDLLKWGRDFYRNANQKHVDESKKALLDLSLLSKELYLDLKNEADFLFQEQGLMMLFQTDKVAEEEMKAAKIAEELGIDVSYYSKDKLHEIHPGINALGGIHYRTDAHLSPNNLMEFLKSELEKMGVEIYLNSEIRSFETTGDRITSCSTSNEQISADEFILTAGSWSPLLSKKLGLNIKLLPGKGYSFDIDTSDSTPEFAAILCEGKVSVSPLGNKVRFGGTLEITKVQDMRKRVGRVDGIVNTVNRFYPNLELAKPDMKDVNIGYRPCTSNGMPIISRSKELKNLIVATGHGMMGLSMGAGTGKLVESLVSENQPEVEIERFTL